MNINNEQSLLRNLCIRNEYKEKILQNRCQELRSAQMIVCDLERRCTNLKKTLGNQNCCQTVGTNTERQAAATASGLNKSLNQVSHGIVENLCEKKNLFSVRGDVSSFSDSDKSTMIVKEMNTCLTDDTQDDLTEEQRKDIELNIMVVEKEDLRMQLETTILERDRASNDCIMLRNQLETANQKTDRLLRQVTDRENNVSKLNESLLKAEEQKRDLSQEVDTLQREVQGMETTRIDYEQKIEELEELLMVLESEKIEASSKESVTSIETSESSLISLNALVKEKDQIIDRLLLEKNEVGKLFTDQRHCETILRSQIITLEKQLEQSKRNPGNLVVSNWEKERKELMEQIEILGAQLAQLQSEMNGSQQSDGMLSQHSQQMSQLFSLKVEASTLQVEKGDLEDKLLFSKQEIETLRELHRNLENQLKHLEEESTRKDKETMKLKQRLMLEKAQLLRTVRNLQAELKEEKLERQRIDEQLKSQEVQNAELVAQLMVFEDKNNEVIDSLQGKNQQLEILSQTNDSLSKEVAQMSCYVKDLTSKNQQLQMQSIQLAEALGRAEEQFRKGRTDDLERMGVIQTDLQKVIDNKKGLEITLNNSNAKICSLQKQLKNLIAENKMLENAVSEGKKQLSEEQKLNQQLRVQDKRLQSNTQSRLPVPTDLDSLPEDGTPCRKRLKTYRSSVSTTQVLQTPSSTQKSLSSRDFPLPHIQDGIGNLESCLPVIVPESPLKGDDDFEDSHLCTGQTDHILKPQNLQDKKSPKHIVKDRHVLSTSTPTSERKFSNVRRSLCLNRQIAYEKKQVN